MPPHASLSSRDGRSTSSSIRGRDPYYYSNGDIKILHEVVSHGEEILPTLPKRDRLATTALFQAADIVLRRYNIDLDANQKFSNVLFRIGGIRNDDSLCDKFRSVLGDMGIVLEYVEHPELEKAPSVPSGAPSSSGNTVHSGTFPISLHYNGHRRRNSDSVAQFVSGDHPNEALPRRRSVSFVSSINQQPEIPRRSNAGRHIDPWLSQIPSFQHDGELDGVSHGEDDSKSIHLRHDARFPSSCPIPNERGFPSERPDLSRMNDDISRSTDISEDINALLDGNDSVRHDNQRRHPAGVGAAYIPQLRGVYDGRGVFPNGKSHTNQDPYSDGDSIRSERDGHHSNYNGHGPSRYRVAYPSNGTRSDVSHDFGASVSASARSDEQFPQTPRSHLSGLDSDGFHGASDTTVQDEMDGPPPRIDPSIMAKMADTFLLQVSFMSGFTAWQTAKFKNWEKEKYAVQMDKELSASEAVLVWSERAGTIVREVDELDEPSGDELEVEFPEGGFLNDHREKMMRRAGRAYNISIMHKAFTHWQVLTDEEVERTDIARRHLLRKKFFGAWREQNVIDDEKVYVFALKKAVRLWWEALAKQEGVDQVAVQLYQHDLAEQVFWSWVREHQEQTATTWQSARLKNACVQTWRSKADRSIKIGHNADARNAAKVLDAVFETWKEEVEKHSGIMTQVEKQESEELCRTSLRDWQEQAALESRLGNFLASRNAKMKTEGFHTWTQKSETLHYQNEMLRLDFLRDCTKHWDLEARLASYTADFEYGLKSRAVYDWMLEERLVFFERYREEELQKRTLKDLKGACYDAQSRKGALREIAEKVGKENAMLDLVHSVCDAGAEHQRLMETANKISSCSLAREAFKSLAEGITRHEEMEGLARRGAYYVIAANAISGWSPYAQELREERLRTTYHHFRRNLKRSIASDSVSTWIAAMDASLAAGWEADEIHSDNGMHELIDTMNHWIIETNDKIVKRGIAEEADTEMYLSKWRFKSDSHQEDAVEASDHAAYNQLEGCWDAWELQSVQARGRQHTAAELYEKNNKRMCRHVMSFWHQTAAPDQAQDDLQSSYASRHSTRRGSSRTLGYSTPRGPMTEFDEDQGGPSRFGSSQLQPITEYDEEQSMNSQLRSSQAHPSSRYDGRPVTTTNLSATQHSSLPRRFGSISQPEALAGGSSTIPTPFTTSQGPPALYSLERGNRHVPHLQLEQHEKYQDERQRPRSKRLSSLQQRLQEAARMVGSVQLGPMAEFDEEEDNVRDDGNEVSTQPAFIDTPTRWTGVVPRRDTTTPMAPLPSYLRREYSSGPGGLSRVNRFGPSPSRQTSRVTFADVRDHGGEDESENSR